MPVRPLGYRHGPTAVSYTHLNVIEKIMLDIMFKLPSMPNVKECLINRAVIEKGKEPVLLYGDCLLYTSRCV